MLKKDMSAVLHKSGELARCHQRLTTAARHKERHLSWSAAADLAGQASSLLLLLQLPNKTDTGQAMLATCTWLHSSNPIWLHRWLGEGNSQQPTSLTYHWDSVCPSWF